MAGIVAALNPKKNRTVIGIDSSTNSFAWSIWTDGIPVECGEIKYKGNTTLLRLEDASVKIYEFLKAGNLKGDIYCLESTVGVASQATAIKMAYISGMVMGLLITQNGGTLWEVAPIKWQSFIGNKLLTKAEKDEIKLADPGKSESWYKNKNRLFRKERTMQIAKKHFAFPDNVTDNVSDAVMIGYWASQQ